MHNLGLISKNCQHRGEAEELCVKDLREQHPMLLNFISPKKPFNSLTTVGYLLELFIRLWIPSLVRISTSAWS